MKNFQRPVSNYFYLVVISVLFLITYSFTIIWMWGRWSARDSYYSHGSLVPLISAFLIYRKRDVLGQIPVKHDTAGLYIFIFGILLQIFSAFWRVHFISGFSMPLALIGIVIYLYGFDIFKAIAFPMLFLFFMVPVPLVVISELSLKLKLLTTKLTILVSDMMGIAAVQAGNVLYFPTGQMVVGDVCSGLRSLISLLAMGALYAHLLPVSNFKKWIMFLSAVPISVIANMVRMLMLCVIANIWGVDHTTGLVHDSTGILIYVTAFLLLFSLDKLLLRRK